MELFEALVQRQSGRNYAEQPVEMEKLRKCVEAAQLAPSACNSQPWSFVVVSTPDKVKEVTVAHKRLENLNSYELLSV